MEHLTKFFLSVFNMSITASYVILLVIILRLLLKKAPKLFSYALWAVVLFRLIVPFSFSSALSFLKPIAQSSGSAQSIPSYINIQPMSAGGINSAGGGEANIPEAAAQVSTIDPPQTALFIFSIIWISIMLVLIVLSIVSYIRLKRNVSTAIRLEQNIYECENIETPFVLGIIKPNIYIPMKLKDTEKSYILKHENTHIRRLDYIVKPIAFLALCIHWFNPLVWISFKLMGIDMEMSCDESVVRELGGGIKKDYTMSLLSISSGRRLIGYSPLAFGEGNARIRIKNILNYKKPSFWVVIVCIAAIAISVVCLVSNPAENSVSKTQNGAAGTSAPPTGSETKEEKITINDLTEKEIVTPSVFQNTRYPLIAKLPQDGIYLYGLPDGVALKYGDNFQIFGNWNYLSPTFILPRLKAVDMDGDNKKEIICVLNVGSGVGVHVEELHVLKLDDTGKYTDYIFKGYLEQAKILLSYGNDNDGSYIDIGKIRMEFPYPFDYTRMKFDNSNYGSIVRFDMPEGIKIDIPLDVTFGDKPLTGLSGRVTFEGDVIFKNGAFQIINPRLVDMMM